MRGRTSSKDSGGAAASFKALQTVVCLLWIFGWKSWTVIGNDEDTFIPATEVEPDFKRLENEYAIGNVTTTTDVYDNGTSIGPIPMDKAREVRPIDVGVFKPSVHLGEIEEFRSAGGNPFNKLQHIKFENFLTVTPDTASWHSAAPENGRITSFGGKESATQSTIPDPPRGHDSEDYRRPYDDASFFRDLIKFPSQFVPSTNFWIKPTETTPTVDTIRFVEDFPMIFDQPVNFYGDFNFVTPFGDPQISEIKKPLSFGKYGPPISGTRETTFVKNQNFPYQFYQAPFSTFEAGIPTDKFIVPPVPRNKSISPWKKIIKLIGSILPFGLLLASLSPNVVQIGSSTQSSIPLSKLKDIDLPPEHKGLRMAENLYSCEDKDICEIIVEGSKPESNVLQNILWNFVSRAPEETAHDNGLRKLFRAVKRKDCSLLAC